MAILVSHPELHVFGSLHSAHELALELRVQFLTNGL